MEPLASRPSEPRALAAAVLPAMAVARERLGVRRTALFWLDDDSGRLACVATTSTGGAGEAEGWLGQTLATGVGMAGRAVREGRPVWTPDLLADPEVPVAPWLRERLEQEGLRAVAAAPVRLNGVIRGALGFLDAPGRTYDEEALRRIEALADEVARHAAGDASHRS
jgi:GAF domain-containing protein